MTDSITRLNAALEGRYRIQSELGEGGMANVYLADDLKHERKVALKVLKPELAAVVGAERFLTEIKTTANLQHPHILPLFDSGEADSFLFYVMPYVEGETLRDRLEREKQLPVDEAVRITIDVAEALQAAHEQGVIHRDIKPANILMSKGRPLVADFGIALAVAQAGGGRLTETGLSMGTPYYMSPEQASADREPNPASDVYSLGCVLYEMLVGEPPYVGGSAQAVLAKILTEDVRAPTRGRPSTPANVDSAIRKALEKLPADRFSGAHDFARALADSGFRHGEAVEVGVAGRGGPWTPLAMGFGALAAILAVALGWAVSRPPSPLPVTRVSMGMQESQAWTVFGQVDISADGSFLVYEGVAEDARDTQLWLRRLDALDAVPVPGTQRRNRRGPDQAIAPDGERIVVRHDASIRVYPLFGGEPTTLVDHPAASRPQWSPDGRWVYYTDPVGGISRVNASGGEPEVITEPTTGQHHFVQVLPDGRSAIFEVRPGQIAAVDIESREVREVGPGEFPRYAGGFLFFLATVDGSTTLYAAPFDSDALELTGPSFPIAGRLPATTAGNQQYAVSGTGTLVYQRLGDSSSQDSLVFVGRDGLTTPIAPEWSANFGAPALSPDATRILVRADDGISVFDLRSRVPTQISLAEPGPSDPSWSPDGRSILFAAPGQIFTQRADGSAPPELLLDQRARNPRWLPDGRRLLLNTSSDILTINVGDTALVPIVAEPGIQANATLSPDGSWLAYMSSEAGEFNIYVRPFPDTDAGRTKVSIAGGTEPVWANSGQELFYRGPDAELIAVQIQRRGPGQVDVQMGERQILFDASPFRRIQSIMPDDQYFVATLTGRSTNDELILVQNIFEELRAQATN